MPVRGVRHRYPVLAAGHEDPVDGVLPTLFEDAACIEPHVDAGDPRRQAMT